MSRPVRRVAFFGYLGSGNLGNDATFETVMGWLMTIGGIMRIVLPQFAVAVGATIYGGRTSIIVAALVVGALGAFLSVKGYVPPRPGGGTTGL